MAVAFVKVLSILVVALLVVPGGLNSGQVKAEDCRKEKEEVIALCGKYSLKRNPVPGPPSASCCNKIKASDIACVCRALTPAEAKNYNMTLSGRVLRECGYAVHAGFKCGGDIVPEA
ncbi:uncharacterized protein LOC116245654 isoform X3 [Nymphaea colorata]|nr:uncharacterized protein LOC116245654 isoform X1 [Nymphaea colorata]XP_049933395.1 uncharacterized protein LOC116245654 isoform X3 [Nymphaea colorata]